MTSTRRSARSRRSCSEEGSLRDILADAVRPLLVVGLALAIFQQLIGINTVIYYAPTILKSAGVATSGAIQQTVFIGLTNLVFTIVAVLLLDRLGRRALLLTGTAGCVVALIALGAYFASPSLQDSAGWLALTSLIVYIASFAIGLGPVFWLMISEIFPLHLRGPGDGRLHGRQLGVQLRDLVHVPDPDARDHQAGHVLAVRRHGPDRAVVLRDAGPGDEGPDARGDRGGGAGHDGARRALRPHARPRSQPA